MPNACTFIPDLSLQKIDSGRIQLLNILGSGSYGVVYRGVDCQSQVTSSSPAGGRTYAVKCLLHPRASLRKARHSLEIECHLAVSDHPNVLTLHKIVEEGDYIFLVLDFCPGGDLFSFINRPEHFYKRDCILKSTFLQIIDAVEHCHNQGVYHRDLKPENILCSKDGSKVVVADFGLATRQTVSNDFGCGSAFYMSPECIGKDVAFEAYSTRPSDIWSLGVILTNLMTGRGPWHRAEYTDECYLFYLHEPSYLGDNLPISRGAERILLRIFTRDPQRRITLAELKEEIADLDTFFMSDADLPYAGPNARLIAASLKGHCPVTPMAPSAAPQPTDRTSRAEQRFPLDLVSTDITEMQERIAPFKQAKRLFADIVQWFPSIGSPAAKPLAHPQAEPIRAHPLSQRCCANVPIDVAPESQESADEVYSRFQNARRIALPVFAAGLAELNPEAFTIGTDEDSDDEATDPSRSDGPATPTAASLTSVEVAGPTNRISHIQLDMPALAFKRLRRIPSAVDLRRMHGIGRLRAVHF